MVGTADLVAPENLMVGNLTAACAGAALADVGTDAECQMAYDALLPFRGRIGTAGPALILGAQVDTSLARLARRLGRPEDARIHVDEALALATSLGASLLRLLAEIAEAELHAETGDIEAARARIEATERDAIDVGAKLIAAFATRTREAL